MNVTARLIAVCGLEGSGKSTVSSILESCHNYKSYSFAKALKKALSAIFGWKYEMLLGISVESRTWREQVDEYWATELGIPGFTPRMALQVIGTDVLRKHFDNDIWIKSLKRKILASLSSGTNVVITDCRFPNEANMVKEVGGSVVTIKRDCVVPPWMEDYLATSATYNRDEYDSADAYLAAVADDVYYKHRVHPAETSLLGYDKFDCEISNNGSLEDLNAGVLEFLHALPKKLTIAFDFDDVIVPYMEYFLLYCSRVLGRHFDYDSLRTLNISDLFECSKEDANKIFAEFLKSGEWFALHLTQPTDECLTALHHLKSLGHNLVVVTARSHNLEGITKAYLSEHLPGIFTDSFYANYYSLAGDSKTKLGICLEQNCSALIDDNPAHIGELLESHVQGVLFGDKPWNVDFPAKHKIGRWSDLKGHFAST